MRMIGTWNRFHFLLSLATLLLLFTGVFATVGNFDLDFIFFNSDTLYQPSLYRDLFEQGNELKEWRLNPAPNFFPDMLLYSLLMGITGSIQWSSFLFALIQITLIDFLLLGIYKVISDRPYPLMLVTNVLLMLFPLAFLVSNDFFFVFFYISNSYHLGCFVMVLLGLYLLVLILKQPRPLLWFLFFLTLALGTASDKLFITNFIIPVAVYLIYLSFFKTKRKRALWLLLATPLGAFFGWFWVNFFDINGFIEVETPHSFMNFANIGPSLSLFMNFMVSYVKFMNTSSLIWLISGLSLLLFLARALYLIFKRPADEPKLPVLLVGMALCIIFAPVLAGNFTGVDTIRYNYHALILLVALLPYILTHYKIRIPDHRFTRMATGALSLFLLTSILVRTHAFGDIGNYFSYYPDLARKADAFSRQTGIKSGTAEYWKAKVITHFSKEGVLVVPTFEQLLPWDHATSKGIFWRHPVTHEKNAFRFTLWSEPATFERLREEFGDSVQIERITVEGQEFIVHPPYSYEPTYMMSK